MRRLLIIAVVAAAVLAPAAPTLSLPPRIAPQIPADVHLPAGFAIRPFAATAGLLPTSLTWGPGPTLYVTAVTGNAFGGTDNGVVLAFDETGVPSVAAQGLDQPLGIEVGPGPTLYVSETDTNRGRVSALTDPNGDGTFEGRRTVIANLPNGRHQTNGLTFGSDGSLYVANGNATDDGLECGPALVPGSTEDDCPAAEIRPWTGSILRVDPTWTGVDLQRDIRVDADTTPAADGRDDDSVLAARGFRNIYDVQFDPQRPRDIWTAMNGPDNPSGSEPVYGLDATAGSPIEDAGFPSCLYDPHVNAFPQPQVLGGHEHEGSVEPVDNPNRKVTDRFGKCRASEVLLPKTLMADGHEGTSGIAFVGGSNFPAAYRNDLLVAEWGSLWNLNGGKVTGHKVVHVDLNAERKVVGQAEFLSGLLPMDVTFGPDGHLYVADMAGQIYDVFAL